ncbi:MAG: methyltransferase domain-containing protein [Victivallaceae bacterium]
MNKYLDCLRLNLRMGKLALSNRWLGQNDYAASYDRLASSYDREWLAQLQPVTDRVLKHLPESKTDCIVDLGCGTGYTTAILQEKYQLASTTGVDISREMLNAAKTKCPKTEFKQNDLLEFLKEQTGENIDLIVSTWAIGYSKPAAVIAECARTLRAGGTFGFVVNYFDTLKPVFNAFRCCMLRYPERINLALWPRFPKNRQELETLLINNRFKPLWTEEGSIPILPPDGSHIRLEWLLQTGVLAGFDQVMPLHGDLELSKLFNQSLAEQTEQICHHYYAGIFIKKER